MIVEDDLYIRESLGEFLRDEGFKVLLATNGSEGLRALRAIQDESELPGVILLDLMMPIMDGYAFRREQVADARLKDIPVIVMTADSTSESKVAGLQVGAFLKKPIDIDRIQQLVETLSIQRA